MGIHVPVKPIPVLLKETYLYDMEYHPAMVPAHVVCISSYKGSALTFDLKIDSNGAIFSYLPANAFCNRDCKDPLAYASLSHLGCFNCPDENIQVSYWDLGEVTGYWPKESRVMQGSYLLTMDWPDANELIHMFKGVDGRFYFRPNHKLLTPGTAEAKLPDYKKLHQEWIVE